MIPGLSVYISLSKKRCLFCAGGLDPLELEMTPLSGICLGLGYLTIVHQQMDRADELSVVGGKTSCHNDKENMFSSRYSYSTNTIFSGQRPRLLSKEFFPALQCIHFLFHFLFSIQIFCILLMAVVKGWQ